VEREPEARPTSAQLVAELAALEDQARQESTRESLDARSSPLTGGRAGRTGSAGGVGAGAGPAMEPVHEQPAEPTRAQRRGQLESAGESHGEPDRLVGFM
jgi:hypothetical protein